jgi:predicted nucleic acid-binding protein
MPVVVDANLLVVLASRDARAPLVQEHFETWMDSDEQMFAPELLPHEVANGFTRLVAGGHLSPEDVYAAWHAFERIPVQFYPVTSGSDVVHIALTLHRTSAYDAAYIALALEFGCELWTLDGPLARNAQHAGLPVRLLS